MTARHQRRRHSFVVMGVEFHFFRRGLARSYVKVGVATVGFPRTLVLGVASGVFDRCFDKFPDFSEGALPSTYSTPLRTCCAALNSIK